jgi:hypothetical protein
MTNTRIFSTDISVMSVADVLVWLGNRERTGTLTIEQGSVSKTVRVDRGHVVRVSSTSPREDLGQFLLNFGVVSAPALEHALVVSAESDVRLGRVLTLGHVVDEAEVRRVLEHQIREAVLDTARWDVGELTFHADERGPNKAEVSAAVSLLSLHKLAAARAPHWAAFHLAFPRLDVRLSVYEPAVPADADPVRDHILTLVRKGATVESVLQQVLLMEYELYARMYELVRAGVLRTVELRMPPPSISPGEIAFDLGEEHVPIDRSPARPRPVLSGPHTLRAEPSASASVGPTPLPLGAATPGPRAPGAPSNLAASVGLGPPPPPVGPPGPALGAARAAAPTRGPAPLVAPPVPSPLLPPSLFLEGPASPQGAPPVPHAPPSRITSGLIAPPMPAVALPSPPQFVVRTPPPSLAQSAAIPLSGPLDTAPTLRVPAWPTPASGSVVTSSRHYAADSTGTSSRPSLGHVVVTPSPELPSVSRTPPSMTAHPPHVSGDPEVASGAVPQLQRSLDEALRARSSPRERYILKRIDGARTVGDILQIVPMSDREVLDVLRGLAAEGVIRF